jgi:sialate O-acetylesterase
LLIFLSLALFSSGVQQKLYGDIRAADIFGDFMVLQRNLEVPIWGKAAPGEKVIVEFGGQKKSTIADDNGKWVVKLDPMEASQKGRIMTIKGGNSVKFTNVLVGEVWICSGQSNMEMSVNAVKDLKELRGKVIKLPIRTYSVPCHIAKRAEERLCGGWAKCPPSSAVGFGFAYFLQKNIGVPVGIILSSWGSSSIECWMPMELGEVLPHFKEIMERENRDSSIQKGIDLVIEQFRKHGRIGNKYTDDPEEDKKVKKILGEKSGYYAGNANIFARMRPNLLYNAMLHGAIPYAVRGMVWYQGEENATSYEREICYAASLKEWTKKLRELWGDDKFTMLVVMLPGFGRIFGNSPRSKDMNYPGNLTWAYMRESQMRISELPNAYVVNTIDLGDVANIHPKDKEPLCRRLALMAAGKVYGKKEVCIGPVFDDFKIENGKIIIKFKNASKLKTTDNKMPESFWITDRKHKEWYPAQAKIKGNMVILSSPKVAEPVSCRYAFAAKPYVNLVNEAGLPAYPFRTDKWEP